MVFPMAVSQTNILLESMTTERRISGGVGCVQVDDAALITKPLLNSCSCSCLGLLGCL